MTEKNKKFFCEREKVLIAVLAAFTVMMLLGNPVLAQTIPVDSNPQRVGQIVGWVFRIAYIALNILGIVNIFQGVKMWSDGQQGTSKKIVVGLVFLVPGLVVGLATELAAGNLPDLGFGDLFGGGS